MNNTKNSVINLTSFIISGLIGLYIYFYLTKYGGVDLLGKFNIHYVLLLLLSQLGTLGIHYSILRLSSEKQNNNLDFANLYSGLTLIFISSFVLFSIIEFLQINLLINSPVSITDIKYPSLLFALNRGIYWYLNGKEEYIKMAIVSPSRMILYFASINNLKNNNLLEQNLSSVFLITEIIILVIQVLMSFLVIKKTTQTFRQLSMFRKHLMFSKNAFVTSFLTDISLKVDLIVISFLLGNNFVGLYTFTSALGEGFIGILNVTRTISTPKFIDLINDKTRFKDHKKNIFKICFVISGLASTSIIAIAYFFGERLSFLQGIKSEAFSSLLIVIIGFFLMSYFFSFEHILLQLNHPFDHTKSLLCLFVINLTLNILLINLYDLNGAAVATVLSYVIYFFVLNFYLEKRTGEQFIRFK
tara:strand:- start:609 stop:1853 length:1245 start_codon:yes stop_codon:yes gene_type:complete